MKKYLIIALVSVFALSSCGKSNDQPKVTTWSNEATSTKTVETNDKKASTWVEVKTSTWNEAEETKTWTITEEDSDSPIQEKDWVITYKHEKGGYEISYKKSSDLKTLEDPRYNSVWVSNTTNNSSISFGFEDYSQAKALDTFDKYTELSIENLKKQFSAISLDISNFKKEVTEFAGMKWYKITYKVSSKQIPQKMSMTQYVLQKWNDKKAYTVTKWIYDGTSAEGEKELDEIMKSFKITK